MNHPWITTPFGSSHRSANRAGRTLGRAGLVACVCVACGTPGSAPSPVDGSAPPLDGALSCQPRTCGDIGATCGAQGDGCGGLVSCGTCPASQTCGGGGTPNQCGVGSCTPTTCAKAGANCGPIGDGCGNLLQCGTCTAPQSCGSGGQPSVCGGASNADGGSGGAPRPIAPLSTSRVTTRRPTLRWVLPSGVTDATVDLCFDRACTRPIGSSAHVTGTSYAVASDLPTGVVFWRLHPSTATTPTSATWEFTVPARSAPIDTSWGTTLDVNGDGYADVAIGAFEGMGHAYVYPGSASGLATAPTPTLSGSPSALQFGQSIRSAGDVNGDGYADLIVGAPPGASVSVYLGSASGINTTPDATLTAPVDGGLAALDFGASLASAGDVNSDGYADVVIGAIGSPGYVYLFLGGASGLSSSPALTLTGPDGASSGFGSAVTSADVNGDGYPDVLVGAGGFSSSSPGWVNLYLGSMTGLTNVAATTLTGPDGNGGLFGASVANAGDLNGDGYADFVVGAYTAASNAGRAYVYLGSASGLGTAASPTLVDSSGSEFGFSVASAGDVNGDGYSDLVVGGTDFVGIYLGSASGIGATPTTTLTGQLLDGGPANTFGASVASAGDINGDGYADVVVGNNGANQAYVYPGGSAGLGTTAASTLLGPNGGGFGRPVFGATH